MYRNMQTLSETIHEIGFNLVMNDVNNDIDYSRKIIIE